VLQQQPFSGYSIIRCRHLSQTIAMQSIYLHVQAFPYFDILFVQRKRHLMPLSLVVSCDHIFLGPIQFWHGKIALMLVSFSGIYKANEAGRN